MNENMIGTNDLEEFLDKDVVVLMKDGKYIFGIFRSFDQFHSVTIEEATERIFCGPEYCEKKVGVYVIRGENVVLICINSKSLKDHKKISYEKMLSKVIV